MLQKQAGLLALICQQRIKRKKHLHICRNEHKKMWIWHIKHSMRLCATNQRKHKQIKLKIFILIANSLSNIYIFYRSFLFFSMIISNISSFSLYIFVLPCYLTHFLAFLWAAANLIWQDFTHFRHILKVPESTEQLCASITKYTFSSKEYVKLLVYYTKIYIFVVNEATFKRTWTFTERTEHWTQYS
jgi:hypothetical protein